MPNREYKPISCALHSEYELLAMHQTPIKLTLNEGSVISGKITDILARSGAEYLLLTTDDGSDIEIRMDRIKGITN